MTTKPTTWPSIDEQLTSAKVARSSALERLIRDNQDFHLLEPEEAHDDAGLPLWLRVHWRKQHPDLQHQKVNPGQGYPDVLYNILEWMLAHPDLPKGGPGQPDAPPTPPTPIGGHGTHGKKKGGTP